jgi:poly-beta-1,6-N-acetyl-D-glucosamine synthase
MRYSVITPIKNEESYIDLTIESVLSQKILPHKWVIIDDSSTDNTRSIISQYLPDNEFIELISAPEINIVEISARIAKLLNIGYESLRDKPALLLKLDADVFLPQEYSEFFVSEFSNNPTLGIASGCVDYKGTKEKNHDNSLTRGAAKFYRKNCFEEIGQAYLSRGWDTIDNYAAQSLGWETKKYDIYFKHNKEEGEKSGLIMLRYWTGLYNGRVPYYLPYFIFKIIYYTFSRPVILGSLLELIGYFKARFFDRKKPFPGHVSKYIIKIQKQKIIRRFRRNN